MKAVALTKIFKSLLRRPFVRNVAIVASGTAGAQAITLAFAPLITRLYGPEAFGVVGIIMAVVGVVTPVATLNYPVAIVLQRDSADALGVARLSLIVAAVTSGVLALILYSFKFPINKVLGLEAASSLIFFIPIMMFLMAAFVVMNQWAIRGKLYKLKSKVAVLQALLLNGAKSGIGLFTPTAASLLIITALGSFVHVLMLVLGVRKASHHRSESTTGGASLLELAKRNRDFPIYRAPQDLINAASQSLPIILLSSFFGPVSAGLYTLARSVMALPSALVAQSVAEVFYPRIAQAADNGENRSTLILKATIGLAGIGLAPFLIVFAVGPWLFGIIFGAEWVVAGEYARWLSLMLFFNFINRPSVAAVPVLGLQRGLLVYEIVSTAAKLLVLYLGFVVFKSDQIAVSLFGIVGAITYIALIVWVIAAARSMDMRVEYASKAG